MPTASNETLEDTLKRRYRSRALSRRYAKENARKAATNGRTEQAAECSAIARQHLGACGEITKIARDSGISLDTYALNQQVASLYDEIEETLRIFEATRPEGE